MQCSMSLAPSSALPVALLATAGFLSVSGMRVTDALLHVIATDFGTTIPRVSVVVAAFTLPYGLCQIVLGRMGDRFGKLRVMTVALGLLTLANLGCALSAGLESLTLLRVAAGGASAAVVPLGSFPFLAPYMHEAFGLPYAAVGLVLACFGLGAMGYVRSARVLVPRLGEPRMVLLGGAIMAASVAASVLVPGRPAFVAVLVLAQLGMGFGFYPE